MISLNFPPAVILTNYFLGALYSWTGGSTWLALGITFWEGLGCSTAGYFIVSSSPTFPALILQTDRALS